MDEQKLIDQLKKEGYDPIYGCDAESGEVDEEHDHDFDTKLVVITGDISITSVMGGAVTNMNYKSGQEVLIPRNVRHAAKVGKDGCRYLVAEKH